MDVLGCYRRYGVRASSAHKVRQRAVGDEGPCVVAGEGVADGNSKYRGCWWWERGWVRPSKHLLSTDHNGPRRTFKYTRLVSLKWYSTTILLQKILSIFCILSADIARDRSLVLATCTPSCLCRSRPTGCAEGI